MDNQDDLIRTISSLSKLVRKDDEVIIVSSSKKVDYNNELHNINLIKLNCKLITYWMPPSGVYPAINSGVSLAKGNWLNIIHSGDIVIADSLNEIHKLIKADNVDIIICNQKYGPNIHNSSLLNAQDHKTIIPHQSTFYKRKLHIEHSFYDETKKTISDQLFFKSVITDTNTIYLPIIYCFFNTNGISSKFNYEIFKEEILLKDNLMDKFSYVFKGAIKMTLTFFGPTIMQAARSLKNYIFRNKI
jgi:hypothetical protein